MGCVLDLFFKFISLEGFRFEDAVIHFYFILIYCQQVLAQMQPSSLIEIKWRLKFFGLGILVLLTNINSIVLLSYMGLLLCFCS